MAKLIRACAWRKLERPYTRKSKYRAKNFVRAFPNSKIVKFDMGEPRAEYDMTIYLRSKDDVQLRHNSIESGRLTCLRLLEKKLGKKAFYFKIRPFPHHVLRNNPLASGAGADRMSTGMKMSFGKPVGIAARVKKGQIIFEVRVQKAHLDTALLGLNRSKTKFPCGCSIEVIENKKTSN